MCSAACSGRDDSKKVLKKLRRKQGLFLSQEPDANVSFIEGPSHHVFIGNGGLHNAVSGDVLNELFTMVNEKDHSTIKQLYMPFGKDYAFASFTSVEYTASLVEALNGVCIQNVFEKRRELHRLCPSLANGPPLHLYMCFVDKIPRFICTHAQGQIHSTMVLPPGLILVQDFISQEEESNFLKFFAFLSTNRGDGNVALDLNEDVKCKCSHDFPLLHQEVDCDSPESALKHRRVKHYGYEFLYGTSNVNPDNPLPGGLPEICMPVLKRMLESALICEIPDQLTVNQYVPGAGIPAHVDTHSAFEDGIISISLGSQVVMDFRHPDDTGTKVSVLLARRSLLIMTGQSRYLWTHSIPARKTDTIYPQMPGYPHQHGTRMDSSSDASPTVLPRGTRLSLTFRKVRRTPCNCVKSFSGYYPSCSKCLRKLRELKFGAKIKSGGYWCRRCQLEYFQEEAVHRYCVGLTVTNHITCTDVVVFGKSLNPIFGASASAFHRWLIGLQSSSRDLEFSQPIACLLQRSLDAVFIGKCFAFNFRHPYGVSSDTNLVASGIKPLGSINSSTNVITLLKRHFDQRKTFPSVDLHLVPPKRKSTTPSQSVALTCGKAHNTIHCSQRNSFLYESVHVSTSQVPHEVHFESYCNESSLSTSFLNSPRAPSCVNNCPALLDATFKGAPQVKPALSVTPSLSSTHVPVTVTEYCEEQETFTDDSEEGEEATMTDSEAVEILQELISDWESSQITVDENSMASSEVEGVLGRTDLDSLHHNTRAARDSQYSLEDCSFYDQQPDGSLLCLSEAVIAELQSSFNRSANFTPFCSTKLRRSSSSVGSAISVPLASAMSYESPELFSSASSLASVTQRFGRSNPKQSQSNLLTEVSPELFGSSKPTLPATPSQMSSCSFCNDGRMPNHYITPTMHRQNMSRSRRNILCDISNKLSANGDQISSQQAVVLGSVSNPSLSNTSGMSPQVKTHMTTPSGQVSQDHQFSLFSPDLFSPS